MKRFLVPIGIAAVVLVAWLAYTLSQLSKFHALQKVQILTLQQFQSQRPSFGLFQLNGGRLAYEFGQDGKRELTPDGAVNTAYVPYTDPNTKSVIAIVEIPGESAADLHPQAYTDHPVLIQVQGLVSAYDTIEPAVISQFQSDHAGIPEGTPLLRLGDSAPDPQPAILHAGILALLLMAAPFGVALLMNKPKPTLRPRDDYERYKPSWRK
jgi:hypothetical protein